MAASLSTTLFGSQRLSESEETPLLANQVNQDLQVTQAAQSFFPTLTADSEVLYEPPPLTLALPEQYIAVQRRVFTVEKSLLNTNLVLLFDAVLKAIPSDSRPQINENVDVDQKAEFIRDWMGKNQKILDTVKMLVLTGCKLTVLVPEITLFRNLQHLNLSTNKLEEVPEFLGDLVHLKSLYFSHNPIKVLPNSLGKLSQLECLFADHCKLEGLPRSFERLVDLQLLCLNGNLLKNLPRFLVKLRKLRILCVASNLLEEFPAFALRIPQLQKLNVSCNKFEPSLVTDQPSGLNIFQHESKSLWDRTIFG